MGDAGPPTPDALLQQGGAISNTDLSVDDVAPLREVKVLVTGFGVGAIISFAILDLSCLRSGNGRAIGFAPRMMLGLARRYSMKSEHWKISKKNPKTGRVKVHSAAVLRSLCYTTACALMLVATLSYNAVAQ